MPVLLALKVRLRVDLAASQQTIDRLEETTKRLQDDNSQLMARIEEVPELQPTIFACSPLVKRAPFRYSSDRATGPTRPSTSCGRSGHDWNSSWTPSGWTESSCSGDWASKKRNWTRPRPAARSCRRSAMT